MREGDQILLGGSSELLFTYKENEPEEEESEEENVAADEDEAAEEVQAESEAEAKKADEVQKSSKLPLLFGLAGLTFGLAIVVVVGAVLFSSQCGTISASACEAKAIITSPETGDTIAKTVDVELETENDDCVASAVFTIDGKEFASTEEKPFTVKIDPAKFADKSDGFEHNLAVILFDEEGNQIAQPGEVALVFETQEIEPIEPD